MGAFSSLSSPSGTTRRNCSFNWTIGLCWAPGVLMVLFRTPWPPPRISFSFSCVFSSRKAKRWSKRRCASSVDLTHGGQAGPLVERTTICTSPCRAGRCGVPSMNSGSCSACEVDNQPMMKFAVSSSHLTPPLYSARYCSVGHHRHDAAMFNMTPWNSSRSIADHQVLEELNVDVAIFKEKQVWHFHGSSNVLILPPEVLVFSVANPFEPRLNEKSDGSMYGRTKDTVRCAAG